MSSAHARPSLPSPQITTWLSDTRTRVGRPERWSGTQPRRGTEARREYPGQAMMALKFLIGLQARRKPKQKGSGSRTRTLTITSTFILPALSGLAITTPPRVDTVHTLAYFTVESLLGSTATISCHVKANPFGWRLGRLNPEVVFDSYQMCPLHTPGII